VSQFVIPRQSRRGIQNALIFPSFPGFPFDFAQGGEPVEPRVSLNIILLARNDSFVELPHSLRFMGARIGADAMKEEFKDYGTNRNI
jgi:hypothetical protein